MLEEWWKRAFYDKEKIAIIFCGFMSAVFGGSFLN
jgi:hypothetical protein